MKRLALMVLILAFAPSCGLSPSVDLRSVDPGVKAGSLRVNRTSGLKEAWIPPGKFTMGCSEGDTECSENEKPAHPVTITKGFWMGQSEVTVGAYRRYSKATGKPMPPEPDFLGRALNPDWKEEEQPIVNVTFQEAADYCAWAGMRLPTEAEWEYAARAGSRGSRYGALEDIAWYVENSGNQRLDSARVREHAINFLLPDLTNENGNGQKVVGQKLPNAWKLYDMLGNASEWTADWYGDNHYKTMEGLDPQGPPGGTHRVLRGGAWLHLSFVIRVTTHILGRPEKRDFDYGFRCAGE